MKAKRGVFELAHGGVLFLDEIGEMPLSMQSKLLRVLQERKLTRLGSEAQVAVDFRLMCATHRDLKALVESGQFREDLYYRIHVIHVRIPRYVSVRRTSAGSCAILSRPSTRRIPANGGGWIPGRNRP
ncbi:MAG: sigma 54-interacting transcriptional regulator [Rhodocyclaceae bacterium]|nr:sigma 54-interacting transcriptional regulator [Rhodocyclaceae bacterium]